MSKQPIQITKKARKELKKLLQPHCMESAQKIADSCNMQSSWGGYTAIDAGNRAVVVGLTHEASVDNARAQRILKSVSHGRV